MICTKISMLIELYSQMFRPSLATAMFLELL